MRILFTNTGSWGTGAGAVIDGVAAELIRRGHRVKVICLDLGLPSADKKRYYGRPNLYHIIKFPVRYRGETFPTFPLITTDPNPRNYKRPMTYKELSRRRFNLYIDFLKDRFSKIIGEFKPDAIESEHVWIMGYVLSELGYPYVVAAHNSDQIGFRYDRRSRSYAIKCARRAKYIFAISDFVKTDVCKLYGVSSKKVIVIPNSYDGKIFRPKRVSRGRLLGEFGIRDEEALPIVTFGGKLSKTKGVDVLLRANVILQDRCPHLLLLFGAGKIKDALGRAPRKKEMRNVHIVGHVDQRTLSKFHNIATLSVLPSRQEGFAIAALEAMGCGLPLIGTRTGQLEKFVVGGVVPPGDEKRLAGAMHSILSMPPKKQKALGVKALKAASKFSWRDNVTKRLKYYFCLACGLFVGLSFMVTGYNFPNSFDLLAAAATARSKMF